MCFPKVESLDFRGFIGSMPESGWVAECAVFIGHHTSAILFMIVFLSVLGSFYVFLGMYFEDKDIKKRALFTENVENTNL
jgi:hypothetical protein